MYASYSLDPVHGYCFLSNHRHSLLYLTLNQRRRGGCCPIVSFAVRSISHSLSPFSITHIEMLPTAYVVLFILFRERHGNSHGNEAAIFKEDVEPGCAFFFFERFKDERIHSLQ